mmetsp:Transcript_2382/g.4912  ORF Transcript_2382/g.4912 Transcript_2382/m.4912 type:complete len:288 (-) Transcript_2382:720-1583(-)
MTKRRLLLQQSITSRRPCNSQCWLIIALIVLNDFCYKGSILVQAQAPSICACSPAIYSFVLDFGQDPQQSCHPQVNTLQDETNILGVSCQASGLKGLNNSSSVTDVVPVKVTRIQVYELDANRMPIQIFQVTGDFDNGHPITFLSIVNQPNLDSDKLPRGLEATLVGINAAGEPVETHWQILFTNQCGSSSFPVLNVGDQIGFFQIVMASLSPLYCPGVLPTPLPTVAPTKQPTTALPSATPTVLPTNQPTLNPSNNPTTAPPSQKQDTEQPTTSPQSHTPPTASIR